MGHQARTPAPLSELDAVLRNQMTFDALARHTDDRRLQQLCDKVGRRWDIIHCTPDPLTYSWEKTSFLIVESARTDGLRCSQWPNQIAQGQAPGQCTNIGSIHHLMNRGGTWFWPMCHSCRRSVAYQLMAKEAPTILLRNLLASTSATKNFAESTGQSTANSGCASSTTIRHKTRSKRVAGEAESGRRLPVSLEPICIERSTA